MHGSDEVTRQSDRRMKEAQEEAHSLLGKRDPNALLAVALANALAALTLEVRGLRLAQETAADIARAAWEKETGEKGMEKIGPDE